MKTQAKISPTFWSTKIGLASSTFIPLPEVSYREQLLTREWRERRVAILRRDKGRCRNCGSAQQLEVHHRQYHVDKATGRFKMPWRYEDRYLITLCARCHTTGHQQYKIPTFPR